jgi:hypothetical protein
VRGFFSFINDGLISLTSESLSETEFAKEIEKKRKVGKFKRLV